MGVSAEILGVESLQVPVGKMCGSTLVTQIQRLEVRNSRQNHVADATVSTAVTGRRWVDSTLLQFDPFLFQRAATSGYFEMDRSIIR